MNANAPALDYDPFSLAAMRDPHPLYRRLRDEHPAYHLAAYDAWAFSRFADVWDGFLDAEHFSEAEGQIVPRERMLVHNAGVAPAAGIVPLAPFPLLDPPVHTRVRQIMAPPLLKGPVEKLAPLIERLAEDALDRFPPSGPFDLNSDYAAPVAAGVMCRLTGLPVADAAELARLVHVSTARDAGQPGFTPAGQQALGAIVEMLAQVTARRRAKLGEAVPLIDGFLDRGVGGRIPNDVEIAQALVSIVVGGIETVPKILAAGIRSLARHPDQRDEILGDPDARVPPAVEEMLRLHAPAQWFVRTVKKERALGGATLKVGQRAILLVASANRDPREFDDPDRFVWNRRARRLVSFGIGPHFCIGVHVARLELRILVCSLLRRMPRFAIDDAAGRWIESEFQIGWASLPIRAA